MNSKEILVQGNVIEYGQTNVDFKMVNHSMVRWCHVITKCVTKSTFGCSVDYCSLPNWQRTIVNRTTKSSVFIPTM